MNRGECQNLINSYVDWLRQEISVEEVGGACELTTPFLDRHNDHLQVYAKRQNGSIVLSDDGYILSDLRTSGLEVDTPKRKMVLDSVLNGLGVRVENNQLIVEAAANNLAQRLHSLVQAMLAVNDMFYLASPTVASVFYEDVVAWLDLYDIRYTSRVKFTGKTGYDHLFDFVIPKSRQKPERIIQTINRPSRDTAQAVAFAWIDTREVRPPESKALALINDLEQPVSAAVVDALRNYEVTPMAWSDREAFREELAA